MVLIRKDFVTVYIHILKCKTAFTETENKFDCTAPMAFTDLKKNPEERFFILRTSSDTETMNIMKTDIYSRGLYIFSNFQGSVEVYIVAIATWTVYPERSEVQIIARVDIGSRFLLHLSSQPKQL